MTASLCSWRRWSGWMACLALFGVLAGCGAPATSGEGAATGEGQGSSASTEETSAVVRQAPTAEGFAAEGDTIKIGLVASQNGNLRPWGQDSVYGATLAVEEINAAGGINGKRVELKIEDSASTDTGGKTAAEKLMGEQVVGLIGEVSSAITVQLADVAFENGVPLVAIGATNPIVTAKYSN
ncbi:MAG: ABC transporter substrate-binding protein, partial [Fimbriimonadaceae bacterium]|nr:ABC transporter substrate-binding protein [Fimbriimonadaceae bacterium]